MPTPPAVPDEAPQPPRFTPAKALIAPNGPLRRWPVPEFVGEGLTILAGRPKTGKSWLALDIALAVGTGGKAFGSVGCDKGDVLVIDLENGNRRVAERIETLLLGGRPNLSHLVWGRESPAPSDEAFLSYLDDWFAVSLEPRLVVIDGPPRIRWDSRVSQRIWGNDHEALRRLQRWALDNALAVLCVCRTRAFRSAEQRSTDDTAAGLLALADTMLMIDDDASGPTLHVRGRDFEERRFAMRFVGGIWTLLGEAGAVRRSEQRTKIIEVLEAYYELQPHEIAEETGLPADSVRHILLRMVRDRELEKTGWGNYRLVAAED